MLDVTTMTTPVDRTEWPDGQVVADALADPAWRPLPFVQFIVKLHGRCNLSCDYCYMYEMADQSWRGKQAVMPEATVEQVAFRLGEHVRAHEELSRVEVILHGGEPLLAGARRVDHAARAFRAAVPAGVQVDLSMQTNGVLLDDRVLRVLHQHGIRVGVSLDGGRRAHDRHRRYANGTGSYDLVVRGIERLRRDPYRELFAGLLCTVDIANDPIDVYESLLALGPPQVNFLLPHGTWDQPPNGWTPTGTPYADWLIAIFDRWYASSPVPTVVNLFDDILVLVLGGSSRSEQVGLSPARMVVVDTDGALEQVDSLKSTFSGAPATGVDVFGSTFDEAMLHPGVVARQRGLAALAPQCLACPVRDICGGGNYPHRYRAGSGFRNPSVYCADLLRLTTHVRDRVSADLSASAGPRSPAPAVPGRR
jgi:uncharacterized protein